LFKSYLPPSSNNDLSSPVEELLEIFSDYDWQKLELKKYKIEKANIILERLKTVINSSPTSGPVHLHDQMTMQRISDLKEALAKLALPVQYLKGVGPKMAARLAVKKIETVEDLLYFLPRTYEDRREIRKINRLEVGKTQTITGKVTNIEARYYGKKRILEITVSDNTANLTAKWFKGSISYLLGIF
jgi:ATP-dependent DNA helicase RecG